MDKLITLKTKPQKTFIILAGIVSEFEGKYLRLEMLKEALMIFVLSKSQMSCTHEFSILYGEDFHLPSNQIDDIRNQIKSIEINKYFNFEEVYNSIRNIYLSIDTDHNDIIQIILLTGDKSINLPMDDSLLNENLYFDFICFNKKALQDDSITNINHHLNSEVKNKSYLFRIESGHDLFRTISLLTAHPQQRISQDDIEIFIRDRS